MSAIVEKLWPGSTVVCMASGPSLTPEDVAYVRGKARVIVTNRTYQMAPWADVHYGADAKFWKWMANGDMGMKDGPEQLRTFAGLRYSLEREAAKFGVSILQFTGESGLELRPFALRTGANSGYQAINLAVLLGAVRIILLGYDMHDGPHGKTHWHSPYKYPSRHQYAKYLRLFPTLVEPLNAAGVEVVNCTPGSSIHCFPKKSLRDVLQEASVVAA